MADLKDIKKKGKSRLGASPTDTKTQSNVLDSPELAPTSTPNELRKVRAKTGRTHPFGTRVSQEFLDRFKKVSYEMDLKKVELLEASLEAYIEKHHL